MRYEESAPPPELRHLVHRIWLLRGGPAAHPAAFQRAMPDGRAELIFNLADAFESRDGGGVRRQPGALVVGPTRRAMEIRPTGAVDLVGVRFRPEALSAWLRVAGGELLGLACAASDLPLPLEPTLAEQLAALPESPGRLSVLCRHLIRAAGRPAVDPRLCAAVELALADAGPRPAAIASAVGMSHRQLSRVFRERLGFGPKSLIRLGRFQRALRSLESHGRRSVAEVAVRTGYYDQAHLTRDFRQFTRIGPGSYLREAREIARNFIADAGVEVSLVPTANFSKPPAGRTDNLGA
jgi:AraC-like DNA-binding protein